MTIIISVVAIFVLLLPGGLLLFSDLTLRLSAGKGTSQVKASTAGGRKENPRFLVVVPAHDEEDVIRGCARSLCRMTYPQEDYKTVVVADNCSDDTAGIVRDEGLDCLERVEPEKRGKPHALAWAINRLSLTDWDYLVVIDADTRVDRSFLTALSDAARSESGRNRVHYQAYYGLSNVADSWLTFLAGLLVRVRYEQMYLLKNRAAVNCPLTGNGMCFKTELFRNGGWSFFSLTENWEAYAQLTAAGERIEYVPAARLYAHEAASLGESSTRRQRWIVGRYGVLSRWGCKLFRSPRIGWLQKTDALTELLYPGPVLHANAVAVAVVVAFLALPIGWAIGIALGGLATVLPIAVPAMNFARRSGESATVVKSLAVFPFYAVWRIGVTLLAVVRGITGMEWEKTERTSGHRSDDNSA